MNAPHRIAFVGSCQVSGFQSTTRALLPDLHVEAYHVGAPYSEAEILERVQGFDTIVTQIEYPAESVLLPAALEGHAGQVIYLPTFSFTGLHPDLTYATRKGEIFKGAMTDYHSLITLTGYQMGLDEGRVERLFNAHIFAELGYFDAFSASRRLLADRGRAAGYDFEAKVDRWLATGEVFMHTNNHPTIAVLSELAVEALVRAGLLDQGITPPTGVDDMLAQHFTSPIFPPLAKRLELPGGWMFQKRMNGDEPRDLSLRDYIALDFAHYRTEDLSEVRSWRHDAAHETLERLIRR
ncbi:WcbI family polysaccharide biosynthesis putative acetyltransferase [Brevundimonas sp. VNH65]|uniref:WcbI family polysaccharide biosynthesis putative acetyltransferase n=1 Tax=Brevundimonas sp. VNH65 TaxID=3400917 RepID=UPI003C0DD872